MPLTQSPAVLANDDGQPGLFGATGGGWAAGNPVTLVSGTAYAYRIYPKRAYNITLAWLSTSTASGTDDPLEISVFDTTLTTKIATSGSVTGRLNSTGDKTVPLTVSLAARTAYWVVFEATSTASVRAGNFNSASAVTAFGTTAATGMCVQRSGQVIPIVAPLTGFSAASTFVLLALRES